jgi:hypothetical protein
VQIRLPRRANSKVSELHVLRTGERATSRV